MEKDITAGGALPGSGLPGPVIAVAGPTASGKSALAMRLAKKFGGEIVSCDSMQIYRGMDIGTAKPTRADMAEIPHHMIDILDPDEPYSCADYAAGAKEAVDGILARGMLPVVCGGTGLYLESLLYEHPFGDSGTDPELRERLRERAAGPGGADELWEELRGIDPDAAAAIHRNHVRRVIRALEIYYSTGKTKTEIEKAGLVPRYRALVMILHISDRALRAGMIGERTRRMMESGLEAETRALLAAGALAPGSTAAQAIGYKEMLDCIRGLEPPSAAEERISLATRQYAKRQDSWFGGRRYGVRIEIGAGSEDPYPEAERLVSDFLRG